jgi:ankyrin repeat protein
MEMGGNVLASDAQGLTPLHWAATKGQEEIVRILMKEKGDACLAQHAFGRTPLHCAASQGKG